MSKNQDKISELKKQIAKMQAEDDALAAMQPVERLADELHTMLCRHHHTGGCGWHYEVKNGVHDWSGSSHSPYMDKAARLQKFCQNNNLSIEKAIDLFTLIQGY